MPARRRPPAPAHPRGRQPTLRSVHLQRGLAVLAIAIGAVCAEARNSADAQPDSPAAPEPERGGTDVGPIQERIASADDVLQQLDTGARGRKASLFKNGPITVLHPYWQALNNKLDEKINLRLGFSYYALFQYTTPGPAPRSAASGDFDFFGRLILAEGEEWFRGQIGFNVEHRHAYTDIPPSELDLGIGSIWRTTRGFTDSGFNFNELWWNQQFADDRVGFRIGTINQKHFYDLHSFKSQKLFLSERAVLGQSDDRLSPVRPRRDSSDQPAGGAAHIRRDR